MILARWRIVKTKYWKELAVAMAASAICKVDVPLTLRNYEPPLKGKARSPRELPLIPGIVFAFAELSDLEFRIRDLRHVTGIDRDGEGFPKVIASDDMEQFRKFYMKELLADREKLALGRALMGRGERCETYNSFEDAMTVVKKRMDTKDAA